MPQRCRIRNNGAGLVLLGVMIALACPGGARAAWLAPEHHPVAGRFAEERVLLGERLAQPHLALYDNVSQPFDPDRLPAVLCPFNPRFEALLLVDRNPQLRNILARPTVLDVQVTDLLYANLRLRQILEEYQGLRRRTAELLEGLVTPENSPRRPSLTPSLVELTLRQSDSGLASIGERLAQLSAAHHEAAGRASAGASGEGSVALARADSSLSSLTEEGTPLPAESSIATAPPGEKLARIEALLASETSSLRGGRGEMTGGDIAVGRRLVFVEESSELPWIIRFFLAALRFVFAYKYEILAVALGAMAFSILVSVMRARARR